MIETQSKATADVKTILKLKPQHSYLVQTADTLGGTRATAGACVKICFL